MRLFQAFRHLLADRPEQDGLGVLEVAQQERPFGDAHLRHVALHDHAGQPDIDGAVAHAGIELLFSAQFVVLEDVDLQRSLRLLLDQRLELLAQRHVLGMFRGKIVRHLDGDRFRARVADDKTTQRDG